MISVVQSSRLNAQLQLWVLFLLAASLFVMPISSTAKSIFIFLSIGLIVIAPAYRKDLVSTLSQHWCQALLILFFIVLLACVWSPANHYEKISTLKKYVKLLFLPVLVVGFRAPRARQLGMNAFIAAMVVTCLLSMLKAFGLLAYNGADPGQVFNNHIMTGLMMSFAAYLAALLVIRGQGRGRILYAIVTILFSYQILFISPGRTGYVVYVMLMILLIIQHLRWRKAVFALLLGCSLVAISYHQSPTMQLVISKSVSNIRDYNHGQKNNSIGYRMQFHAFAKKLVLIHPWLGNGTGSYSYFFRKDDPVPAWQDVRFSPKAIFEPHSQYWLVAAEFGLLGIIALLYFFGCLLVASLQLRSMRVVGVALLLLFMVGSLSDSLLFYSGTGYFFLLLMALCLGEQQQLLAEKVK